MTTFWQKWTNQGTTIPKTMINYTGVLVKISQIRWLEGEC